MSTCFSCIRWVRKYIFFTHFCPVQQDLSFQLGFIRKKKGPHLIGPGHSLPFNIKKVRGEIFSEHFFHDK